MITDQKAEIMQLYLLSNSVFAAIYTLSILVINITTLSKGLNCHSAPEAYLTPHKALPVFIKEEESPHMPHDCRGGPMHDEHCCLNLSQYGTVMLSTDLVAREGT